MKRIPIKFETKAKYVEGNIEVLISFPEESKDAALTKKDNPNACIEHKLFRFKQSFTER